MTRPGLVARLVAQARERGDCSSAQLALLSGQGERGVRHALAAEESRPEQLLRLHARSASPQERAALVADFAALVGAEVVVLPAAAAGAVIELAAYLPRRAA